jgi:transposase InsO family protein
MARYNGGMIETTLPRVPDRWAPVSAPDSAPLVAELATLRLENAALCGENIAVADGGSHLPAAGPATIFIAVDHYTAECVGIHTARRGTRFETLERLRQGVRAHFGTYREQVTDGLALGYDHGSQFMSDHFQAELRFLGISSSPAFVRELDGNGCTGRLIRTLIEQLLWAEHFATAEHLRQALLAFRERYNREWLIARHDHRSPAAVREAFAAEVAE